MFAAWWSAQLKDYLRLRRSLGFGLVWDEHLLGKFTVDLASRGVRIVTLPDAVAWSLALQPDRRTVPSRAPPSG